MVAPGWHGACRSPVSLKGSDSWCGHGSGAGGAGQGGPSPVSGFSQKQSSCALGLSSTLPFCSHLQRWVCLALALVSAFYGESSYFGICLDDRVALRRRRAVAGAAGALLELSPETHALAPRCDGTQVLAAWVSVCSEGGRPWGGELCGHVCGPKGVLGGLGAACSPPAGSVRRLARLHTDAVLGSRGCGPPGTRLCISSRREAPHGHPKAPSRMHSRISAAASRRLLLPSHKDLKLVPSLSPPPCLSASLPPSLSLFPSLSFPHSLPPSQMATLLTAAKKTLQSPVHISPGMCVELSDAQSELCAF